MLLKISKWFSNTSQWFRYKATYCEMKYYLKRVKHGKEVQWMKPVHPYMRDIGKSYSLVKLALKYNLPIAVPTQVHRGYLERIAKQEFNSINLKTVVINGCCRGKRFETLLIEEGFSVDILYKVVFPMCKNRIGYISLN